MKGIKSITTIKITKEIKDRLANLKFVKKGDSFNSIVKRLIEFYKYNKNKSLNILNKELNKK